MNFKLPTKTWYLAQWQRFKNAFNAGATALPARSQNAPTPIRRFIDRHPKTAFGILLGLLLMLGIILNPLHIVNFFVGLCYAAVIILILAGLMYVVIQVFEGISSPSSEVKRGTRLVYGADLQRILEREQSYIPPDLQRLPQIEIAGIPIPNSLEPLSFFFCGSPGSGKTQAIKRILSTLKYRPDYRAIILDRNGELLESFYREGIDLIFNPRDMRSIGWTHRDERMEPETIAAALVPDDPKDRFFSEAAKSLLSDLYERCSSNEEVWQVISTYSADELQSLLRGGVSARYFGSQNTGASVMSTLVNEMRFYKKFADREGFSFSGWGKYDDPRWIFLPIFEDDAELFRPLHTMAFELMLKGLLSHPDPEARQLKTAIVIDELGALNPLRSLSRLLAEGRKFGGVGFLGTQTEAQLDKRYGEHDRRIILQGTATKLILNCRDSQTAEIMASLIGKQERIEVMGGKTWSGLSASASWNQQIRETHAVLPAELQALPNLEGYLTIANGTPPARVKVEPQSYPKQVERFISVTNEPPLFVPPGAMGGTGSSGGGQQQQHNRVQNRER